MAKGGGISEGAGGGYMFSKCRRGGLHRFLPKQEGARGSLNPNVVTADGYSIFLRFGVNFDGSLSVSLLDDLCLVRSWPMALIPLHFITDRLMVATGCG